MSIGDASPITREILFRAVGEERLDLLWELLTRAEGIASEPTIPLRGARTVNDVRAGWFSRIYRPLVLNAVVVLELLDQESALVGRNARCNVDAFLREADKCLPLVRFFGSFDSEVAGAYATMVRTLIVSACAEVLAIAAKNEAIRDGCRRKLEGLLGDMDAARSLITRVEISEHVDALSPEYFFESVTGVKPRDGETSDAVLPGDPIENARIIERNFRLIVTRQQVAPWDARNLAGLAWHVATSDCPLLAHLSAVLTWEIAEAAFMADPSSFADVLSEFYAIEAGRIMEVGRRAEEGHLGDDMEIVNAYRSLVEGVFRPFATLLIELSRLASGEAPHAWARLGVNEIKDRFSKLDYLGELLDYGLARPLRNASAHEEIVRLASGALGIAHGDGTVEPLNSEGISWLHTVLRSALTGIDLALNFGLDAFVHLSVRRAPMQMTESLLRSFANLEAMDVARGSVSELKVRGDTVTITFHGEATEQELAAMVKRLWRFFDESTRNVFVLDPAGVQLQRAEFRTRE